jgi:hypothetical protein
VSDASQTSDSAGPAAPAPAPDAGSGAAPATSGAGGSGPPGRAAPARGPRPAGTLPRWRRLLRLFTAGDAALALLGTAVVIYYWATRGIFQGKASGDGFFGFLMLPGVLLHHTFDLAAPAPEWAGVFGRERSGLVANGCPIGPALLWTPTYLLGLVLDKLAAVPGLGAGLRLLVPALHASPFTGREESDFFMAGLGSLAAGLLGARLTFDLVARKLGVAAARFGVVGAVVATPLCFYLVTQPLYQHACAFFGVALFVERWDAWRGPGAMTLRRWAALGALGGVAMLMRQQEGLFFLLPATDALAELGRGLRRRDLQLVGQTVVGGLLFLACALLVYSPQLLLWRHYYGTLRPPQEPGHFIWWNPAIIESLFSMRAGLFPWVPVLYLAVPGLIAARRRLGGLVWRLGLVFALELWLNSAVWDYHGSWAFGPRRYTDAAGVVALGLGGAYAVLGGAAAAHGRQRLRRALLAALALLAVWNVVLMELVRTRRVKSASAGAYPAAMWAQWAGAPASVVRALDRIGYPFMQPVSALYALRYRMSLAHAEGLLGGYLLERDWKIRAVILSRGFAFADRQWYLVQGARPAVPGKPPAGGLVPVESQVRIVLPLMAREPLRLSLSGELRGQGAAVRATFNGTPIPLRLRPAGGAVALDQLDLEVPESVVHSRGWLNELVFDNLAEGSQLKRLDLSPVKDWWRR